MAVTYETDVHVFVNCGAMPTLSLRMKLSCMNSLYPYSLLVAERSVYGCDLFVQLNSRLHGAWLGLGTWDSRSFLSGGFNFLCRRLTKNCVKNGEGTAMRSHPKTCGALGADQPWVDSSSRRCLFVCGVEFYCSAALGCVVAHRVVSVFFFDKRWTPSHVSVIDQNAARPTTH